MIVKELCISLLTVKAICRKINLSSLIPFTLNLKNLYISSYVYTNINTWGNVWKVPDQTENKQISNTQGFGFKMAEWEDVRSPPARAPQAQLAVEQPLTGGTGTHQKRCPTSKDKEEAAAKKQGGFEHVKNQIPYPPGGRPTDWRVMIPRNSSHCCRGSEPHVRLPSLGLQKRDWESPGNLTLKATGI